MCGAGGITRTVVPLIRVCRALALSDTEAQEEGCTEQATRARVILGLGLRQEGVQGAGIGVRVTRARVRSRN